MPCGHFWSAFQQLSAFQLVSSSVNSFSCGRLSGSVRCLFIASEEICSRPRTSFHFSPLIAPKRPTISERCVVKSLPTLTTLSWATPLGHVPGRERYLPGREPLRHARGDGAEDQVLLVEALGGDDQGGPPLPAREVGEREWHQHHRSHRVSGFGQTRCQGTLTLGLSATRPPISSQTALSLLSKTKECLLAASHP